MASFEGSFHVPSGDKVDVLFHWTGLEEYLVNGKTILSSRKWEMSGIREFSAGNHRVRIEFSLWKFLCEAYVDGELAVPEVFKTFQKNREKSRKRLLGKLPGWLQFLIWLVVFLVVYKLAYQGAFWLVSMYS